MNIFETLIIKIMVCMQDYSWKIRLLDFIFIFSENFTLMYRPFSLNSAKSMSKNGSSRTKNVPFTIRKWCTAPGSPLAGLTRKSDSLTGWMVRLPNNRLPEVGYDFNKVSSYFQCRRLCLWPTESLVTALAKIL